MGVGAVLQRTRNCRFIIIIIIIIIKLLLLLFFNEMY